MSSFPKRISRKYYVTAGFTVLIYACNLLFTGFKTPESFTAALSGSPDSGYIGSRACMQCHKNIYDSHVKTAHYRTSRVASAASIKGSFDTSVNRFRYNQFMEVLMEEKGDRFFQSAYISNVEYQSEPFDIVIGSGRKGQTYLYWQDNRLFQLPVSYYVPSHAWCNSPGFPSNMIYFDRPIQARCIECHGTYAKTRTDSAGTLFDRDAMMYGVDCERCHGPAARHARFQMQNPAEKKGFYIVNPKLLSRQQRMDACALCHSGFRRPVKPAFSFAVGDRLGDFSLPSYNPDSANWLDVHGNQYGLLVSSKCYLQSEDMDCSSCHNVHREEIANPALYSMRCVHCHNGQSVSPCKSAEVQSRHLTDNCIDCHMPLLPSKKIFLEVGDRKPALADLVRTHRVAIYPEQTKNYLHTLHKN